MNIDYEIVEFKNSEECRRWLISHHRSTNGIWLRLYKKASGVASIAYAEALDQALCFGWIDGQMKSHDELSYIQKFTPRRKASLWSKRNIEHVERLTKAGLMMPAGLEEVEKAKADGRWSAAYDKPSEMVIPGDFLDILRQHPKAETFFAALNQANRYAITWRLQTAKTQVVRDRRLAKIIAMLEAGEKFHG